jgi:hypothetical protein
MDAALACKEHEPPGYPVSLDQLVDPENELVSHLGEKNWGLAALMHLMERLKPRRRSASCARRGPRVVHEVEPASLAL